MDPYPHHYSAKASAAPEGHVALTSPGLSSLTSAPPAEFGGPGDQWSPETLLVAAVADCFILTFRAVAAASKLEWKTLTCEVEGVLDRVDRQTRFTRLKQRAHLELAPGVETEKGRKALEKAEHLCLVTNSLSAECLLETEVVNQQA